MTARNEPQVPTRDDVIRRTRPERSPSWRTTYLGADTEGSVGNTSWGAIFAGVVVALAVMMTFSLVASALGLGIVDPTSDDPFDGVGTAVGLWTVLTLAVGFGAGGFVAGVLAVRAGFLHGLAVWATSAIALMIAVVMAVSGLIGAAGSIVGTVASAVGTTVGTVADVAGDAVGASVEGVVDQLGDVDTSGLTDDVEQVLVATEIPELQPEYLQNQVDEVRGEVADAAVALVTNPGSYEEALDELAASLEERASTISEAVDQEAIAAAVAANTDLTEDEAQAAVANAVGWTEGATDEVAQFFGDAEANLTQAREDVGQLVDDARQGLDDASDAASRAAVWAFIGLLLGAAVTAFAGLWGSRLVVSRTETGHLRTRDDATSPRI